jgi:flagellar hook-associated protein 2
MGGGQFQQAIKAMVEAEKQPVKVLESRKGREETKLKSFGEFKAKFGNFDKTLSEFSNFKKFRELKVDLGDGAGVVGITVDKEKAEPGTYTLEVSQLANKSSVLSNGFEKADENILGVGFVVVKLNSGESAEIYVDEDHASLKGVAELINRQSDSPIRASVIQDNTDADKPFKLLLAGKKDGVNDGITFPDFYFLDGTQDIYIDGENQAQNALIKLDGFEIESGSNMIPDFLTGVNLQLKQARPDQPVTITITEDYQKVSGKVKGLVDQVNGILDYINKQNQVDDKSDTRATFAGDTGLQTVEYRLRNLMHEGFPVGDVESGEYKFVHLNELGVEFNKAGLLDFKEEKFQKALEKDFSGISQVVTGEYGIANQLKKVITGYTRTPDGFIANRENALRGRIKRIDDDIAQKEARIEKKTQALVEQYSRLQGTLAKMQSQQQYLASMGGGGGGNLISQLMGSG